MINDSDDDNEEEKEEGKEEEEEDEEAEQVDANRRDGRYLPVSGNSECTVQVSRYIPMTGSKSRRFDLSFSPSPSVVAARCVNGGDPNTNDSDTTTLPPPLPLPPCTCFQREKAGRGGEGR